ncbi:MAG: lipopolysaccharide biosynthesis protein [Candidatus Altiarchaeales archaeon]|nr:lipopolysaccharide biosynthesis protein [Candidatus Altiarchaeales archaeon]
MKTRRFSEDKLYSNATLLMARGIVTSVLGFFFWTIVARLYSTEDVGLGVTMISAATLLALISTLGFEISIVRFLPSSKKEDVEKIINSCLMMAGIFCILVSTLFITNIGVWSAGLTFIKDDVTVLFLFMAFVLSWLMSELIDSVFISQRTAKFVLFKGIIASVLKFLIALVALPLGAFGIFVAWGVADLISLLVYYLYFIPKILPGYRIKPVISRDVIDNLIRFSFANYSAKILGIVPILLLPLMITSLLSEEMSAYFYIAWMIANVLFIISFTISQSLLAEASTHEERMGELVIKSITFALVLIIPGIVFLLLFGDWFLLLFGADYSENATQLLHIFALSSIPFAFTNLYFSVMNIRKRLKNIILMNALVAVVTLIGSYVLIADMGLMGVGFSWICARVLAVILIGVLEIRNIAGFYVKATRAMTFNKP